MAIATGDHYNECSFKGFLRRLLHIRYMMSILVSSSSSYCYLQYVYSHDVVVFSYLLLCSIFLCYQGNMLRTNHVGAFHWNWL